MIITNFEGEHWDVWQMGAHRSHGEHHAETKHLVVQHPEADWRHTTTGQ